MKKHGSSLLNAFMKTIKESQVSKDCKMLLDINRLPNWRNNVLKGWFRAFNEPSGKERAVDTGTPGLSDRSAILPDGKTCEKNNAPYICVSSWIELAEYLEILGFLRIRIQ